MSTNDKRRRHNLLLLTTFVLAVVLLVMCICFMFKLGSLQKQVNELKEVKKSTEKQVEDANASAKNEITRQVGKDETPQPDEPSDSADASGTAQTPEASVQPKMTQKPEDGTKYVYLTFDDGPSENTERILAILAQYNVKATFFVNGHEDEQSIARFKKIADAGHALAMHSYSHDYKTIYSSLEAFQADYQKISSLLERITGKKPTIYRFPGGSSSSMMAAGGVSVETLAHFLHSEGVEYFDWNSDSTDGEGMNRPTAVLLENVNKGLRYTHNVVLMHDAKGHDTTVEALPSIIQSCIDKGMTFSVIDESVPPVQHRTVEDESR